VAPLEARVQAVTEHEGLSEREARHRIATVEGDRRAFLLKHFHADLADPTHFDLVVNTAVLGVEGACGAIQAALARMPSRPVDSTSGRLAPG
jgi:cytidylate kinase